MDIINLNTALNKKKSVAFSDYEDFNAKNKFNNFTKIISSIRGLLIETLMQELLRQVVLENYEFENRSL